MKLIKHESTELEVGRTYSVIAQNCGGLIPNLNIVINKIEGGRVYYHYIDDQRYTQPYSRSVTEVKYGVGL